MEDMKIQYKVKIKVREYGQAKGTSYPEYTCSTLKECCEKIEQFFGVGEMVDPTCYPEIRIKAEMTHEDI